MTNKKGFTLIELLVVVAIIGILATVVLASLGTARERSRDAAAKAAISQIRAEAEIIASGTVDNSYATVCDANNGVDALITDAGTQTNSTPSCFANAASWVAAVTLNNGAVFCADSTGYAGNRPESGAVALAAGVTCTQTS